MADPHVLLTTDRLVLRRFTLDDAEDLLALDSDPLVRRFVEDGEPVTRERTVEMIEHWLQYRVSNTVSDGVVIRTLSARSSRCIERHSGWGRRRRDPTYFAGFPGGRRRDSDERTVRSNPVVRDARARTGRPGSSDARPGPVCAARKR